MSSLLCPLHGPYTPNAIMPGAGCPTCSRSPRERETSYEAIKETHERERKEIATACLVALVSNEGVTSNESIMLTGPSEFCQRITMTSVQLADSLLEILKVTR